MTSTFLQRFGEVVKGRTVYISGPITGIAKLNKPAFYTAERSLRTLGAKLVLNPHRLAAPLISLEGDAEWRFYMRKALRQLLRADVVHVLAGWKKSKGANREHEVALDIGLTIIYQENLT